MSSSLLDKPMREPGAACTQAWRALVDACAALRTQRRDTRATPAALRVLVPTFTRCARASRRPARDTLLALRELLAGCDLASEQVEDLVRAGIDAYYEPAPVVQRR